MTFYTPQLVKLPTTITTTWETQDSITIIDVSIDVMTEAYATMQMPAQVGPNQQGSLKCKVWHQCQWQCHDSVCFAKLFHKDTTKDGKPLANTHLAS